MPVHPSSRREFLQIMAAAMAAAPQPARAADKNSPNLVYVFADQMRFCDMGCAGNEQIRTPNLDKLAGQGLRLANAYSAAPLCSPYRAQLQTGLYGHANGVPKNGLPLNQELPSFAKVFDAAGYATGYIGKWHLSGQRKARKGKEMVPGFVPPGGQRMGWNFWAAHEVIHKYLHSEYFRDQDEAIPIPGFESDFQTDLAIEFMRQNRSRPFSLMLSWGPPHEPYQIPERARNYYDPAKMPVRPNVPSQYRDDVQRELTKYYSLITCLDENMGRLMGALEELGLARNTILVFTSDHGNMIRSQGMRLKQKPWEESAHIPFLIRDPRTGKSGKTSDLIFNSIDIMPTMLGMCGLPVPRGLHGIDWSAALSGRGASKAPDSIYLALDSEGSSDEGRAAGAGGRWRAVRTREWMYVMQEAKDWLLYDVAKDPYQMNNLAEDRGRRNERQELKRLMDQWIERTGDKPWAVA
jgi:arylsulfatase A-like enzyme